jgi:hypothetical protein
LVYRRMPPIDFRKVCLFRTRGGVSSLRHDKVGFPMKKLSLAMAAALALLSVAGCAQYVGKGKAPPPVVTKG